MLPNQVINITRNVPIEIPLPHQKFIITTIVVRIFITFLNGNKTVFTHLHWCFVALLVDICKFVSQREWLFTYHGIFGASTLHLLSFDNYLEIIYENIEQRQGQKL